MNKRSTILLIATLAYSLLFYHQSAGINFLIFNLTLVALSIWLYPEQKNKIDFWYAAMLSVLAGTAVAIHASSWSIWLSIITSLNFSLVAGSGSSTVWMNLFHAVFTQCSSFIFLIIEWAENKTKVKEHSGKKSYTSLWLTLIISSLLLLFVFLYKNTNPIFAEWTRYINFDWLSIEWLIFTIGGLLLLYPFFRPRTIQAVLQINQIPETINAEKKSNFQWLSSDKERGAASLLFILLNILLLMVNGIDVYYLYLNQHLPSGMSHSDFVHEGIGSLIASIVVGSILLIYIFRAELNYSDKKTLVQAIGILWLLQNLFLISSTLIRNHIYVEEFQLTYKRIGVFIYLLLASIGILSLCYKIIKRQNFLFLLRINTACILLLFTLLSFVDFDRIITKFNIEHAKSFAAVDKWYLTNLSGDNSDQLAELRRHCNFNESTIKNSWNIKDFSIDRTPVQYYDNIYALDKKIYQFLKNENNKDLRSYSIRSNTVLQNLKSLSAKGAVSKFDLSNSYYGDLSPLTKLPLVYELKINSSGFTDFKNLSAFPHLMILSLDNNYISNVDSLPALPQLKVLSLNNNNLSNASSIQKFKNLNKLDLINCGVTAIPQWVNLQQLKELNLSENPLNDFRSLQLLSSLNKLTLNSTTGNFSSIPQLKQLRELSISFHDNSKIYSFIQKSISNNPELIHLTLSNNKLLVLDFLTDSFGNLTLSRLNHLDLSNNRILQLSALTNYQNLKSLNVSTNELRSLCGIEKNKNLNLLDASQNNLNSIHCLKEMNALQILNLSNNPELVDFTALENLRSITELRVSHCGLNNLHFIESLDKLEILEIKGYSNLNWQALKKLKSLKTLHVSNMSPELLKTIVTMRELKTIYLDQCDKNTKEQLTKLGIQVN